MDPQIRLALGRSVRGPKVEVRKETTGRLAFEPARGRRDEMRVIIGASLTVWLSQGFLVDGCAILLVDTGVHGRGGELRGGRRDTERITEVHARRQLQSSVPVTVIQVFVWRNPELSVTVPVRPGRQGIHSSG